MINGLFRRNVLITAVIVVSVIFLTRLFYLQVVDTSYSEFADQNAKKVLTKYPVRGLILDRNKKLMVFNDVVYDLMVNVPTRLKDFDTAYFCELMDINTDEFVEKLVYAKNHAYMRKGVFKKNLDAGQHAKLLESMYAFGEFFIETRTDRKYKLPVGAHVLGYIGEISRKELDQQIADYYNMGDYIGKSGMEQYYEEVLRGIKGEEIVLVDHLGRIKGSFAGGKFDSESESGKFVLSSIDLDLQAYGEKLMANKIGSIVAIEPSTGEILALVSSPAYDPNQFNVRNRGKSYPILSQDKTKPLYNRAVSAMYPPGSVFKVIQALIALEEGVISPDTRYPCNGGYRLGSLLVRCHPHSPNPDLEVSLSTSCNSYYCNVFKGIMQQEKFDMQRDAYLNWVDYLYKFGLGKTLGIDVNNETPGILKDATYFDKLHGSNRWTYSRIISLSIGQGELGITPVQMANLAATIANRGFYYIPHTIKRIEGGAPIPSIYKEKRNTRVSPYNYEVVVEAMSKVLTQGTAVGSKIKDIEICGKTGTVQNPHGENHSVFIAFAPKVNPKIAIATVVENAGYGATWAAPIASLMIERYLKADTTERKYLEERILKADLIPDDLK